MGIAALAALGSLLACTLFVSFGPRDLTWLGLSGPDASPRSGVARLRDVHRLSDAELREGLALLQEELARREDASARPEVPAEAPSFRYVHKKTYATSEPIKAAYFLEDYFGGKADRSPFQHHCDNATTEQPQTKNVYWPATKEQPKGFTVHFVRNPHKAPYKAKMNASQLGLWVERWRGNFSKENRFDQYMDNHLGLVFDSLDPLVEKWQRDGVPFICRTWCCGPGMPQFPLHCPGKIPNTYFCEQGCYVEAPHGIVVEALCGLEGYQQSRKCLSRIQPEELKIFDFCTDA